MDSLINSSCIQIMFIYPMPCLLICLHNSRWVFMIMTKYVWHAFIMCAFSMIAFRNVHHLYWLLNRGSFWRPPLINRQWVPINKKLKLHVNCFKSINRFIDALFEHIDPKLSHILNFFRILELLNHPSNNLLLFEVINLQVSLLMSIQLWFWDKFLRVNRHFPGLFLPFCQKLVMIHKS